MKPLHFVPICALAISAVAVFEACSSSSSNGGVAANDQDAAIASGDGSTGPGAPPACGAPPYITLGLVVEQASTADPVPRIGGATLTSPLCPDASFVSDDDGGITGLVSSNVPFYGRFNAPGYAPTLSPEEQFTTDLPGVAIAMPPSLLTAIVPNYDKTKPVILIDVRKDTGTDQTDSGVDGGANCNDPSGVSFTVDGHPEAAITYYSGDSVPAPITNATATVGGVATVTGLDASASPVSITATKTGCTISFLKNASTGKIPLENAYVSIAAAYLRN